MCVAFSEKCMRIAFFALCGLLPKRDFLMNGAIRG